MVKILFAYENGRFGLPIRYAASALLSRVGMPYEICEYDELDTPNAEILLTYGRRVLNAPLGSSAAHVHIAESPFWASDDLSTAPMPSIPLNEYEGIPILYWGPPSSQEDLPQVHLVKRIYLPCDLIASTFFMLSRYEEVFHPIRDKHERFPADASIAVRGGIIDRPIVDEYATLLRQRFARVARLPERKSPWGNHPYAFCLTHDVDHLLLFKSMRNLAGAIRTSLRRRGNVIRVLSDFTHCRLKGNRDPYNTFAQLVELERVFGVKATYFFMGGGKTRFDDGYDLTEVHETLQALQDHGHEIGLHGSYNSFNNKGLLSFERDRLETVAGCQVRSFRQHYLRFRVPNTWRIAVKCGLEIDSTLGYAQREGFRAGTAYPFQPYDMESDQVLEMWEVPLIVMDATLYGYRHMRSFEALQRILQILDVVQRTGGVFVLLWHNSALYEPLFPGAADLLVRVLERVAADGALMGTMREVVNRWARYNKELACEF